MNKRGKHNKSWKSQGKGWTNHDPPLTYILLDGKEENSFQRQDSYHFLRGAPLSLARKKTWFLTFHLQGPWKWPFFPILSAHFPFHDRHMMGSQKGTFPPVMEAILCPQKGSF